MAKRGRPPKNSKLPGDILDATSNDPEYMKGRARRILMFKDWFSGMNLDAIGQKWGISKSTVWQLKDRDNWQGLAENIREKAYAALSNKWKDMVGNLTFILEEDIKRLVKKVKDDPNYRPTDSERSHARTLMDSMIKVNRLVDEKPTEITDTSGAVTHIVKLPPGMKRYGIIPPADNVKQIESDEGKKSKKKSKITPDDVGE